MGRDDDDRLLRRLEALSPERRAMLNALLDEPIEGPSREEPGASARPLTAAEASLVAIWEQVLGISGIGVHDDFFEIGGDSISAMRVAAKAQKAGLAITVRDLVTTPTIVALASPASGRQGEAASSGSRSVPLMPAQWQAARPGFRHRGSRAGGIAARVERAHAAAIPAVVAEAVRRHDALRLRLRQSPAGWELAESAPGALQVPRVDLSALAGPDAQRDVERLQRELAGVSGEPEQPLCRSIAWHTDRNAGLVLACHPWCADNESIEILRQEISACLRAFLDGQPAVLPRAPEFTAWAAAETGETDPDRDDEEAGGCLHALRGTIERDLALPRSWRPVESSGSPTPLERMALAALVRAQRPEARELRVMLSANARPASNLRGAVGYYVRPMALVAASRPIAVRPARPDEAMQASDVGFTCFFRQALEPASGAGRERWTASAWAARAPVRSRQPLCIHNVAEPGRWRTVWRFDDAVHARSLLEEQCERFLAEVAGMAAARGSDPGAGSTAFAEADLSADELERLFAG